MGEIQRVERSSQDETDWAATVGQNHHTESRTKIFGKKENFSVVKNDMHKQCKLDSFKKLTQNERLGWMSAQGLGWVQQLELCKNNKNGTRKMAQQKTNVLKIECCDSYGRLPTENESLQISKRNLSNKCLKSCSR
jgi:hypothetical protein